MKLLIPITVFLFFLSFSALCDAKHSGTNIVREANGLVSGTSKESKAVKFWEKVERNEDIDEDPIDDKPEDPVDENPEDPEEEEPEDPIDEEPEDPIDEDPTDECDEDYEDCGDYYDDVDDDEEGRRKYSQQGNGVQRSRQQLKAGNKGLPDLSKKGNNHMMKVQRKETNQRQGTGRWTPIKRVAGGGKGIATGNRRGIRKGNGNGIATGPGNGGRGNIKRVQVTRRGSGSGNRGSANRGTGSRRGQGSKHTKWVNVCESTTGGECPSTGSLGFNCDPQTNYCRDDCSCPGLQKCCPNSCGRFECLPGVNSTRVSSSASTSFPTVSSSTSSSLFNQ